MTPVGSFAGVGSEVVVERTVAGRRATSAAGLVGLGAFWWLHVGNYVTTLRGHVEHDGASAQASVFREGIGSLAPAAAEYLTVALACWCIARSTASRVLWLTPALVVTLWPLPAALMLGAGEPMQPIGSYWPTWSWPVWLWASIDLMLVALPGLVAALLSERPMTRRVDAATMTSAAVLGCCAGSVAVVDGGRGAAPALFAVVFLTAAITGSRVPSLTLLIALLASQTPWLVSEWATEGVALSGSNAASLGSAVLAATAPLLIVGGLGLLVEPLARRIRDLHRPTSPQPAP